MKRHFVRILGALVLAASWTALAHAQARASLEVVPFGGYMLYGKHLEGPLGTSISNAGAPIYGAQLGLNLSNAVGIVGNISYGKSDIELGLPILGGIKVGDSEVFAYDASLQLRAPMSTGVSPFIQAGVGALSYDIQGGPLNFSATNMTFVGGVGIDADLGKNVGVRLLARDYVGKFDFQDAIGFNVKSETSHNIALTAGLRIRF